jgi:uncharacterized peroxidase-related enzyme
MLLLVRVAAGRTTSRRAPHEEPSMAPPRPSVVFSIDSAPAASRPALQRLQAAVGMVPNLAAAMAESPALIDAFVTLRELLRAMGTFTPAEGEAISLANAAVNGCDYCAAIHATFGLAAGLDAATVERLREGEAPADRKIAALAACARSLALGRGHVGEAERAAFLAVGYTEAQRLELVARLALSVMANYASHLAHPEPDEAIRPQFRPRRAASA